MKDIISMNDMSKEEILEILEIAEKIEKTSEEEKLNFLKGKIIATLFFEPSIAVTASGTVISEKRGIIFRHN